MKKVKGKGVREMRPEYRLADFQTPGERGKYRARHHEATRVVRLAPDVAAIFPSEKAVNEALRSLIRIAGKSVGMPSGRSGAKSRRPAREAKRI